MSNHTDVQLALKGQQLKKQYQCGVSINNGQYGQILDIKDLAETDKNAPALVLKFSEEYQPMAAEIKLLKKIQVIKDSETQTSARQIVPPMTDYGMFAIQPTDKKSITTKPKLCAYYIMPKYEKSLYDLMLLADKNQRIKIDKILKVFSQLIDSLEMIHKAGYTHNDLKPPNVMMTESFEPVLIDFGFAKKYVDPLEANNHIKKGKVDFFGGNFLYASLNQMKFSVTSRRDDMISFAYILLSVLNNGQLPCLQNLAFDLDDQDKSDDQNVKIRKFIQKVKETFSLTQMTESLDLKSLFGHLEQECGFEDFQNEFFGYLNEFCQSIMSLRFADKPNYNALRHFLDSARLSYLKMKNMSILDKSKISNCFTNITMSSASCPTTPSDTDKTFTYQNEHQGIGPKTIMTPKDMNLSYYSYGEESVYCPTPCPEMMSPKAQITTGVNRQLTAFSWKDQMQKMAIIQKK